MNACEKQKNISCAGLTLDDAFYCKANFLWREIHSAHGAAAALPGGPHARTEQDVQPTRERRVAGEYQAASLSVSF